MMGERGLLVWRSLTQRLPAASKVVPTGEAADTKRPRPRQHAQRRSKVDMLSDAQLEEFKDAFNAFDKDGGGSIDAKELKDLMASIHVAHVVPQDPASIGQAPTENELQEMIAAADADGGGTIDFIEFAALMAHKMFDDVHNGKAIEEAFQIFDASGDGQIDAKEMCKIMLNLGEKVGIDDVTAVLRCVDQDGDGFVSYKEFAAVVMSQESANNSRRATPRAEAWRK